MQYNFDEIVPRSNTASVKYDLRKLLFGKEDLIPLWVADMDFKTPDFIVDAIKNRLDHEILGYSIRTDEYYDSIVNWVKRRHNWEIQKQWISFSPGIVPAINMAVLAFTDVNDKIIVQPPVYFPFFTAVENHGRKLVYNQLELNNGRYHINFEDLEEKCEEAKVLILSNPHNPGGSVWTKDELKRISEICHKHNVLVFADEIHSDLVYRDHTFTPYSTVSEYAAENSLTFIAPSKTFNIAGLATSSLVISNIELKKKYDEMLENIHIGNGNVFGTVASIAAYTKGDEWLDQLMDYLERNLDYVISFIKDNLPQIKVIKPEGTYLVWLDCKEISDKTEELKSLFVEKAGLALNEGSIFGPGGEGFMRLNIACPRRILEKALKQLVAVI